jgi:hypothetical protein
MALIPPGTEEDIFQSINIQAIMENIRSRILFEKKPGQSQNQSQRGDHCSERQPRFPYPRFSLQATCLILHQLQPIKR